MNSIEDFFYDLMGNEMRYEMTQRKPGPPKVRESARGPRL